MKRLLSILIVFSVPYLTNIAYAQDCTAAEILTMKDGGLSEERIEQLCGSPSNNVGSVEIDPPSILYFRTKKSEIVYGQSTELEWQTRGATEVSIEPLGLVDLSGSISISPEQSFDEFTLKAKNQANEVVTETLVFESVTAFSVAPDPNSNVVISPHLWQDMAQINNSLTTKPDQRELMLLALQARTIAPNDKKCFSMVQNKVAWNQSGEKSWNPKNIEALCKQSTNATSLVGCFKVGITAHNDWKRATKECRSNPAKSLITSCSALLQKKVAWNQKGNKSWQPNNVTNLCKGTKDPISLVNCFKVGIAKHNKWKRATNECRADSKAILEKSCFNMVQNKVAWNRQGTTSWKPNNIKNLCTETSDPVGLINCFKIGITTHNNWRRASSDCRSDASVILEKSCFNMVQNKVAWNQAGKTRWIPKNIRNLCYATSNPAKLIRCFKRGIAENKPWLQATQQCKAQQQATSG